MIRSFQIFAFSIWAWSILSLNSSVFGQKGSIIVIQTKGVVEAFSPTGIKLTGPVVRGSVLPEGYAIKTGLFSESVLLFSNGTTATIEENSKFKLELFDQKPFDAQNNSFAQLEAEPSSSKVSIEMETGSLVMQTKKLNKSSSLSITTPLGTAGIRGTQFQIAMNPNSGMKLDVSESQVAFTPTGQAKPILVASGKGLDAAPNGAIKQRPINPSVAKNISTKNSSAAVTCGSVPVATAEKSNAQAEKIIKEQSTNESDNKQSKSSSSSEDDSSESKKSSAAKRFVSSSSAIKTNLPPKGDTVRINDKDAEDSPDNSSLGDGSEDFNIIIPDDDLLPPFVIPPQPPGLVPDISGLVRYSFDPDNNLITIGLYEDGIEVPLDLTFLSLDDLGSTGAFELISDSLQSWNTDDQTKLIHAIGLDVFVEQFIQQGGIDPYNYDDFNIAVQHAVNLAQSFLETITISASISDNQVRSVEGLINEFTNNPYAFEFAQLLAEHGAISNPKNQQATDNLLAILGSDRLSDPDYLSTILGQDLVIGDSYNSQILNGGIIGARNASIDSDVADKLKVRLSNIKALIGGDIFISQDAKIDVSNYLSPKQPGQGTKLFTIAAAKDLSIWGDVTFENTNHAEDHALSLGSAGNFNIQAGSKITYEGSNLGIGTVGDLDLVNIDIDVGGNLALGSLGELRIKSTEPGSSLFSVGRYSDRDNIYLYANNLVEINGLKFNDRAREIYAEAITVDIKNTDFPEHSEVMLRSRDGTLHFNNYTTGGVNLTNVKHLGVSTSEYLKQTDFTGPDGHINTTFKHPNGTPAVRIRSFSNANSSN